ncbi:MAG: hypothetical protein RLP13_09100 [Cytophagales bacterium]
MHTIKLFSILFIAFLITSCNNDDEPCMDGDPGCGPNLPNQSQQDVIVVNEGNFGQANGSLSYINREAKSVINDVVSISNGGITTGDVVQSVYHDNLYNRIFVVSNNESRILVLDDSSFVQTAVIETGLSLPRYILTIDDMIYVTNWNSDFTNSFVAKYNRSDLSFRDNNTGTDPGTEQIYTTDGNNIYVSNNFTNKVQVFEHGRSSPLKTIPVGFAPNGMASVYGGSINVICTDTFGGSNGWIYEIDNESLTVTDSVPLGIKPNGQLYSDGSQLYFSSGTSIYGFDPRSDFDKDSNEIVNLDNKVSSIYGFSLDQGYGDIELNFWVADPKGFTQNGEIHLVNTSSQILQSYEVGIAPNGFLFLGF